MSKHKKTTALLIDTHGNRWKWNCGWRKVDENGEAARSFRPLGHARFRRAITVLDPKDKKQREILHGLDRPGRHWRRYVHREVMTHDLFGSVYLLASDGCHAVVETVDGDHEYVCFENLSEHVAVPLPARSKAVKETTAKAARQSAVLSLINKYISTKP